MEDLMKALASAAAKSSNGNSDDGMSEEQRVTRMREYAAHLFEKHEFTPGQILRHKLGSDATMKDSTLPHVFIRYLDKPFEVSSRNVSEITDYFSSAAALRADCVLGVYRDGNFVEWVQSSMHWEPHPGHKAH